MATTIPDLIAANIITTLEGITVANGYEVDITGAYRPGQVVRPETNLAAFLVFTNIAITEDDSASDYHMSVDWTVAVTVMESDTLETSPETLQLKASMDVVKALNADVTRGTYAYDTIFQDISPLPDETEGRETVLIRFSTPFRVSRSNPYTQDEP